MQNKETVEVKPKIRYYGDSGSANPDFTLPALQAVIRKLFCRWVRLNYHIRDFESALENEATLMYLEYVMAGQPVFEEEGKLPEESEALANCPPVPPHRDARTTPTRLYDDEGDLNPGVDFSGFRAALTPFFLYAICANWQTRDFGALLRDLAISTLYDYQISQSMGGLGGCRTVDEYLAAFD